MPRFKLRTLLIVLALWPMVLAGGYWHWDAFRPKSSPWYIGDQAETSIALPVTPGYRWKLTYD